MSASTKAHNYKFSHGSSKNRTIIDDFHANSFMFEGSVILRRQSTPNYMRALRHERANEDIAPLFTVNHKKKKKIARLR